MKTSIEEKIEVLEKQIHLCSIISVAALIITILLLGLEFLMAEFYQEADWAKSVIRGCIYALYVMPLVIVVPLFFRVNLKGRLYRTRKQAEKGIVNEKEQNF